MFYFDNEESLLLHLRLERDWKAEGKQGGLSKLDLLCQQSLSWDNVFKAEERKAS